MAKARRAQTPRTKVRHKTGQKARKRTRTPEAPFAPIEPPPAVLDDAGFIVGDRLDTPAAEPAQSPRPPRDTPDPHSGDQG